MTTNEELTGRALDEAVARALGHGPGSNEYAMARYGTDPMLLDEMLAWLLTEGHAVCVIIGHYIGKVTACRATPVAENLHTEGTTIYQAVARLVVAVAKAKEAGK